MKVLIAIHMFMGFVAGALVDSYLMAIGVLLPLVLATTALWAIGNYHADRSEEMILNQYQWEIAKLRQEFWELYFADREAGKKVHAQVTKRHAELSSAMSRFMNRHGG